MAVSNSVWQPLVPVVEIAAVVGTGLFAGDWSGEVFD